MITPQKRLIMNNYLAILSLTLLTLYSCTQKPSVDTTTPSTTSITFPEKIAKGTIYEVNIRQHTKEGTINAFIKDLPRLKELGVEMLWIMPAQPIGIKNRKEPLGSYYSIRDYKKVNPEFGTDEDFKNLPQFDTVVIDGTYRFLYNNQNYGVFGRGVANKLGINVNDFVSPDHLYF